MGFIIGKLKCCFCKNKGGVLSSVHGYGIYERNIGKRVFYHEECFKSVSEYPERYSNIDVDMAIQIVERKEKNITINNRIIEQQNENIKKLQRYNFESIMPGHGRNT